LFIIPFTIIFMKSVVRLLASFHCRVAYR